MQEKVPKGSQGGEKKKSQGKNNLILEIFYLKNVREILMA